MNKLIISEIREIVGDKKSAQEICSELVALFEKKGIEDGFVYFKVVLLDMSFYDWVENVSEEFLEISSAGSSRVLELMRLANNLISNQIEKRVTEEMFYAELWKRLWDDVVLPTREDRIIFFQILWLDTRIPYFQIGEGLALSEDEFQKVIERIRPALQKGEFILNANLKSKPQRGSLLLEIADSLDKDVERSVFWGMLIGNLRGQIKALLSVLSDKETASS